MPPLSNTAHVILGSLEMRPMAGYDIKSFVDHSVRHFWAISYGQIYPELKNLEEAGLIESEASAVGSRQRTVYRLTAAGRDVLHTWLGQQSATTQEIRDEMLLRLFFSDQVAPEQTAALLEAMVERHRRAAASLTEYRPTAAEHGPGMKLTVLDFGVDFHLFLADWFGRLRAQTAESAPSTSRRSRRRPSTR